MTIQQDNPRYANPSASSDYDAEPRRDNPLATGKKSVPDQGTPKEWGSLRNGVPKAEPAFGLPQQQNPRGGDTTQDQDTGSGVMASQEYVRFPKTGERPVNNVMARPV